MLATFKNMDFLYIVIYDYPIPQTYTGGWNFLTNSPLPWHRQNAVLCLFESYLHFSEVEFQILKPLLYKR